MPLSCWLWAQCAILCPHTHHGLCTHIIPYIYTILISEKNANSIASLFSSFANKNQQCNKNCCSTWDLFHYCMKTMLFPKIYSPTDQSHSVLINVYSLTCIDTLCKWPPFLIKVHPVWPSRASFSKITQLWKERRSKLLLYPLRVAPISQRYKYFLKCYIPLKGSRTCTCKKILSNETILLYFQGTTLKAYQLFLYLSNWGCP